MTRENYSSTLAIIGAGPKAMAIAAKAKVLRLLGFEVPHLVIYEARGVGHNWRKGSGFTSGELLLGTPPEKDVGFPYYSFCWGGAVNGQVNRLMKTFSWNNFLVSDHNFAGWIDRGRPAPEHARWASYLHWVFKKIEFDVEFINEEVVSLDIVDEGWQIEARNHDHNTLSRRVDAVVITGPGRTNLPFPLPHHPHILTTENFWLNYSDYQNLRGKAIALVGAGENAATVAVSLAKTHRSNRIDIISPKAMNYTRGESYVENHVYTDPFQGNWHLFSLADRKNFIARTDRGVFSVDTKKEIDVLTNIEVIPGECKSVNVDGLSQIILDIHYNNTEEDRIYDYVVITTGFDPKRFALDLLTKSAQEMIAKKLGSLARADLEENISETLALNNFSPTLHLPMLSALAQGPGFPNLSSLGRMSDHILSHHVNLDKKKSIDEKGILKLLL